MFDGELFADFALLYLLVPPVPGRGRPTADAGRLLARALAHHRRSARASAPSTCSATACEHALETLGTGFLQHPANTDAARPPRHRRRSGSTTSTQTLLRIVYRLLFWSVAEDRDALLDPRRRRRAAVDRYDEHFSSARLRRPRADAGTAAATTTSGKRVTLVLDALGRDRRRAAPRPARPRRPLHRHRGRRRSPAAELPQPAAARRDPVAVDRAAQGPAATRRRLPRTSAPRNSARSTSRCSSSSRATTRSATPSPWRRSPATTARPPAATTPRPSSSSSSSTPPSTRCSTTPRSAPDPESSAPAGPHRSATRPSASAHFLVAAARRIATRLATVRTGEVDPTPTVLQRRPARRRRPLHLRRRHQPDGRRPRQGQPLAGSHDPRPAAVLPRPPHQGRQRPARHHPRPARTPASPTPPTPPSPATTRQSSPPGRSATRTERAGPGRPVRRRRHRRRHHRACARRPPRSPTAPPTPRPSPTSPGPPSGTPPCRPTPTPSAPDASPTPGAPPSSARRPATPIPITHAHPRTARRRHRRPEHVVAAVDAIAARHRLFHWHLEFPDIFRVPDDGPANDAYGWTAASTPCSATRPGSASSSRRRSSSPPAHPSIAERQERRRAQEG